MSYKAKTNLFVMTNMSEQERLAPNSTCFGCGVINDHGLRIRSFWEGDNFVLRYNPQEHHQAFKGAINGGIIGTLFDCHMNWCAATTFLKNDPESKFPSTVTAKFKVKLKRVTPYGKELLIKARTIKIDGSKAKIEAEMYVEGEITATSSGTFIAVKEGHPAYHRWD